jgi:hypothetical protein
MSSSAELVEIENAKCENTEVTSEGVLKAGKSGRVLRAIISGFVFSSTNFDIKFDEDGD